MQWHTRGSVINTLSKRTGFFIVALATVTCGSPSGPHACGNEYRGVAGSGQATLADGLSFVAVSAGLSESRKPGRPETQTAQITMDVYSHLLSDANFPSDFLRGHISVIEVHDAATPSRLIKSYFPPNPPLPVLNDFGLNATYDWPITVDQARDLFVADQVVIELHTDRPNQPLVRIPLKGTNPSDPLKWSRTIISGGHC